MEEKRLQFEFVKDTPVGALTWHSAPYTGSVRFIIPKGTRGWLKDRMNVVNHYFALVEGYYTLELIDSIRAKAKEASPIPDRFHGGMSFFISIKTLLGECVRFLPPEDQEGIDLLKAMIELQKEYARAMNCARHEESELFQKMVKEGLCTPQMSEKDRKELLDEGEPAHRYLGRECGESDPDA